MRFATSTLAAILILAAVSCESRDRRVVVYCSQDQEFAETIFKQFESESGLSIAAKFDTEAQKSVALAATLERESPRPRCDVHWNNEILATIRLTRTGVYESYASPAASLYPEWTRAKHGHWQAFASRARVLIVNTNLVPAADRPKSIMDLTQPRWRGQVAMAKPQFGTTATHAASLFEALGPRIAENYFRQLLTNQISIVSGNKQCAISVAAGNHAIGFTDTDDALIEWKAGKPVDLIFPDAAGHPEYPRLGVLFIPNTLAIIKGAPNTTGARKLVDFLLRPESERTLALGGGFQIPLQQNLVVQLPQPMRRPEQVKLMDVDFERVADRWQESQDFLIREFAK